ncbi:glyoxalase [Mannheimia granulomatis]|uniref:VOC family protein n=1 Tax=Mannheimia granulomatis TaxID=85402 RepID=UPI0004B4B24E|nr:VOC family protein [Mannheimia granulomatis]RGE49080.1 glyoxalase [Mannheimia granulomatis]
MQNQVKTIKINALDHLVLTVSDIEQTLDFYTTILGMEVITFGENRKALLFGSQKINLHQKGAEILPNAQNAACGTADLCLLTNTPLDEVLRILQAQNIDILEGGRVLRTGAVGKIESVYCRDPDGNLIEISRYL